MKDTACPYCTAKNIEDRIIIENKEAKAFSTNMPIVLGHVLIVPKRHVATISDLTLQEVQAIFFDLRGKLETALTKAFQADGFNYAWNQGPQAGQSVPHFHLHMLPRKQGDAGISQYEPREFLYRPGSREASPDKELLEITKLIKSALIPQ